MQDQSLFRLDHHVIVVAGAASGIGAAVARVSAAQGATVIVADKDDAGAEAVAVAIREAGGRAEAHAIDVCDAAVVDGLLESTAARLGRLDGVVSTPSINVRKPLLRYTEEELDRVLRVNLKGNFNMLRAAGRLMVPRGRGSIVLFSSIRSQVVEPGQGIYAATKAGILQMARAAAAEFGPAGVRVNALAPGVTETPLTAPIKSHPAWYSAYAAKTVFNRWATADEMAWPTVFLLSDAASYVTGTLLVVDGGWLAADGRFQPPGMDSGL